MGPNLSFPICPNRTCKRNRRGILAAYIRAKQWGKPRKFYRNYWGKPHMKRKVYTRVAKRARKLLGRKRRKRRSRKKRGRGAFCSKQKKQSDEIMSFLNEPTVITPRKKPRVKSASPLPHEESRKLLQGRYVDRLIYIFEKNKIKLSYDHELFIRKKMLGLINNLSKKNWEKLIKNPNNELVNLYNNNFRVK